MSDLGEEVRGTYADTATCCLGCSGICREGDQLVVGPTDDGCFLELRVCSIQRNRSACRVLRAGQAATLALGDFDRALLRKVRWTSGWKGTQEASGRLATERRCRNSRKHGLYLSSVGLLYRLLKGLGMVKTQVLKFPQCSPLPDLS